MEYKRHMQIMKIDSNWSKWGCLMIMIFGTCLTTKKACKAQGKDSTYLRVAALPLVFYTPDTQWGYGASGLFTFGHSLQKPNQLTFAAAFTQLQQLLIYLNYQFYTRDEKYWIFGELGYYDYVYNFFGIGNEIPASFQEKYDARFPRIRASILKKIKPGQFLGLYYQFDHYTIKPRNSTDLLSGSEVIGASGGTTSGFGIQYNLDSRKNVFYPTSGWLLSLQVLLENQWTGSLYSYQKMHVEVSKYLSLGKENILAINGVGTLGIGEIPFRNLASLGGTRRLRGYLQDRYLDRHLLLLQAEYRFPLLWRLYGALFMGTGMVSGSQSLKLPEHLRYHYGGGIRFRIDRKQKVHIRLDYGIGQGTSGFYLTVNEAF